MDGTKTDSLFKTSPSSKAVRRASKAGVSRWFTIDQNDSGYTFGEIANYLERYHESSNQ